MTQELNNAAQTGRDAFERWYVEHCPDITCEPIGSRLFTLQWEAWQAALTTSQPAQAGEVDERVAFELTPTPAPPFATYDEHGYGCDDAIQDFYYLHCQEVETRAFNRGFDAASLPTQPAAQATPEPVGGQPGQAFYKAHSFAFDHRFPWESLDASVKNRYAFAESMLAKAYATPQPATPPQQAAGEPYSDKVPVAILGYNGEGELARISLLAPLPDGTKFYTHPAPGLSEGSASAHAKFNRAIDFAIREGIGAAVFLDAWRHGDTSEWPEFAAAQAKGGEHE